MGAWLPRVTCLGKGDAPRWGPAGVWVLPRPWRGELRANTGKTEGPPPDPAELGCASWRGLRHLFLVVLFIFL